MQFVEVYNLTTKIIKLGFSMIPENRNLNVKQTILTAALFVGLLSNGVFAQDRKLTFPGNFGLPGIIDLPSAMRFPDGELTITHHNHKYIFMTGISFQALPRLGVSFRYGGLGKGGVFAQERLTWDRSFNLQLSVLDENKYFPAVSMGLRDFIGTGWYSSEYIVGTKSFGNLELTAGLGFGRLAGRNSFPNPLSVISPKFDKRETGNVGTGGTLGNINWFQGKTSPFFGLNYSLNSKFLISAEYTSDLMKNEGYYSDIKSPWNFGLSYRLNKYLDISSQYLHGNRLAFTTNVSFNPGRPPLKGGKELAPVPMRLRGDTTLPVKQTNERVIRKVLAADQFEIHRFQVKNKTASLILTNTKFRSTAQAVGRVASTLQRFAADDIKSAYVTFYSMGIITATYQVNLEKITKEQFNPRARTGNNPSISVIEPDNQKISTDNERFTWGVGPYIAHRLFNPDLPLSMEVGVTVEAGYELATGMKISGALRKSVLTNLTDNKRRSNSVLPRVHSDWPLYDFAGQNGHIHALKLSYVSNFGSGFYGSAQAGLLEPFYAGFGGEILFKPIHWPIGLGIDIHRVQKRDYDMRFDLLEYKTTVGHISLYYDAGGMFDVEVNAGRYLAGDWGATTTISRKFGSGWVVGGYATFTDVPFATFGEGSFDKAIFVSLPIDWIISSPSQAQRILTLRPITRDGGANLATARSLYRHIGESHSASFKREFGRLWK